MMRNLTEQIIFKGRDMATLKNASTARRRDQGVLFASYSDENGLEWDEAWVLTETAFFRWSGVRLDYPKDRPFWSYREGAFVENSSNVLDINEIRKIYVEIFGITKEAMLLPVHSTLETIDAIYNDRDPRNNTMPFIERSRTILRANDGSVFEGELLLQYSNGEFKNPKLHGYKFFVDESTRLIEPFYEGRIYRVNKVRVENSILGKAVYIDVRDVYVRDAIEVLIHETPPNDIFRAENQRLFLDSSYYDPSRVVRVPFTQGYAPESGYKFGAVHVETTSLYYALRAFEGYNHFEVYVSDACRPAVLKAVDPFMTDVCTVEVILSVADPTNTGYYK